MRISTLLCAALLSMDAASIVHAETVTDKKASGRNMSLEECFRVALEHNLDVRIKRTVPDVDFYNLEGSYGAYDPVFSLSAKQNFASSPGSADPNSKLFGISSQQYTESYSPSLHGTLPTGLTYSLSGDLFRRSGSSFPSGFQYSTDMGVTLTQPLLKNMWIDSNRMTILLDRKTLKIDQLAVTFQIMSTINSVQQAYNNLIYARDNVRVQEASLDLAERLLEENKKRVQVGALAPLDQKQSESQVATSKAAVLAAQRDYATQQNTLKGLLTDDYLSWHDVLIEPTDVMTPVPEHFDLQDSWKKGMSLRPDLQQSRETVEKQNIVLRYNRNQLFPELDLTGTYGFNGLGTTFPSGLDNVSAGSNPFYTYGVTLSIPLSNKSARNSYKSAKATKEQLLLQLKQLEQQVLIAIDTSVKQAQANYESISATREARVYAEAALDAEQKKLANGASTSYTVLQMQRDLTTARSNEIQALANYNNSLSQLYLNEGSILQKLGFKVEVK